MKPEELRIGGWYKSNDSRGNVIIFKLVGKPNTTNGVYYELKNRSLSRYSGRDYVPPNSRILKNAVPYEEEARHKQSLKEIANDIREVIEGED